MSRRRPRQPIRRRQPNRLLIMAQILFLALTLFVILNIRFKLGEGASQFFTALTAPGDVTVTAAGESDASEKQPDKQEDQAGASKASPDLVIPPVPGNAPTGDADARAH